MMMMSTPDDNLYRDLLKDYAAPAEDAGFTDALMQTLTEHQTQVQTGLQIKPYILGLAIMTGGGIAALQVPKLFNLIKKIPAETVSMPTLPETALLSPELATQLSSNLSTLPLWAAVGMAVLTLVILTTLADQAAR